MDGINKNNLKGYIMKYLIIVAIIASLSLTISAPLLIKAYDDYLESGKCIDKKLDKGVERSKIGVDGAKCYIK